VYEMYDDYIKYLVGQMRSFSDGIFDYLDKHTYEIPIIAKEDLAAIEKEYAKVEESASRFDEWKNKADEFAKKRIKKEKFMDKIAHMLKQMISPERKEDVLASKEEEPKTGWQRFSVWFLGKKTTSPLDKQRSKEKSFIDKFVEEHQDQEEVVGGNTAFSERFKNVRQLRIENQEELAEKKTGEENEAHNVLDRIRKSGQKNRDVMYKPQSYTALANVLMKDASIEVINSFPTFFKNMYKTLRFANITILSSTYTNTMILTSILAGAGALVLVGLVSFMVFLSPALVFANAFLAGIFGATATFLGFYLYPQYKMKERSRNINSNLPFAIDHMAAVTGAGVAPNKMFQLISESKEYGQVSVEIEKIVEYIELFGYDLMSAVGKVSSVCPSKRMKEFLGGFISTIESGGELKEYLRESANDAMLHYRLERQKFTDQISTFSDIYTGLMVASPLFFVAALSMVSILGGTVGNIDVNTLMIMGTYVFIPLLNVIFIVFMEMTQPSI
ncbi:MAG: type II secretion system F family protein, partial [Nanoarchaeota archaeon]